MAITIAAKNYTLINDCEDYNDWSGSDDDVGDFYKEGSQCVGVELWSSGNKDIYYDHPTGSWDMSAVGCHIRLWWMTTVLNELNTDANGGMQVYLSDGSNTGYWYVSGSTSYSGGWYNPVVDVSAAVDAGTKPTAMNAITRIGIRWNLTTGAKKVQSCWIDHVQICDGLIAYGDDGDYFDFDDILAADEDTANAWGVIRKIGGVFYLAGSLEFGDGSGTEGCMFQAKSQVIIFEDRPVNADLYAFDIIDNGVGVTEFILGAKSGTAGVQGCSVRVESASQLCKFDIDGTDVDVDNFMLYGSSFFGADAIAFPGASANVEILGCTFEYCGQVDPDDASVSGCFFINTTSVDAALLWNESIDISSSSFIANTIGAGIEMPSAVGTPYAYDALLFSGNDDDVLNSSGSAISINKNNGSNPTSYEGSLVTFLGVSVDTVITCRDVKTFALIENARVFLEASGGTGDLHYQVSVTIARSGTTATVAHASHGLETGDWIHISGCVQPEYNIAAEITYIDSGSYSYQVAHSPDSPATGSPVVTGVVFNHLTNASGVVSDTRSWAIAQPLTGRARRSTSSPLYQNQPIVETVDKDVGLAVTVYLIPDE